MMFKLRILDANNKERLWFFDNKNLAIYNEDRKLINIPSEYPKRFSLVTEQHNENKIYDVNYISLFCGSNCNYKCAYCPEVEYRNQSHNAHPNDIPKLKQHLSSLNPDQVVSFIITGGEPLVYWKAIKEIIPFIYNRFKNLRSFRFVTNGALLNQEIVDFSKKYEIKVVVSDDGGQNKSRYPRSIEEAVATYAKYNKWAKDLGKLFVIRYQLGRHHLDAVQVFNYFKKAIPNLQIIAEQGVIDSAMPDSDNARESMVYFNTMAKDELRLLSDSRYEMLMQRHTEARNSNIRADNIISGLRNGEFEVKQFTCNVPYGRELHLDFAGNILRCMWTPSKESIVGNLDDLDNVDLSGYIPVQKRRNCMQCPLARLCSGICARATDQTVNSSCELTYADYLAYFKYAIKKLYNVDVLGFYPLDGKLIKCVKIFNNYKSDYNLIKQKVNWEFNP